MEFKIKRSRLLSYNQFISRTKGNDEFWYVDGMSKKEYDNIPRAKKVVLASAVLEGSET